MASEAVLRPDAPSRRNLHLIDGQTAGMDRQVGDPAIPSAMPFSEPCDDLQARWRRFPVDQYQGVIRR